MCNNNNKSNYSNKLNLAIILTRYTSVYCILRTKQQDSLTQTSGMWQDEHELRARTVMKHVSLSAVNIFTCSPFWLVKHTACIPFINRNIKKSYVHIIIYVRSFAQTSGRTHMNVYYLGGNGVMRILPSRPLNTFCIPSFSIFLPLSFIAY